MTNRTAGKSTAAAFFCRARPVWIRGLEREMNCHLGFRAVIEAKPRETTECTLRITACSFYKAFVNGRFLAHGPARGPEGLFRVDNVPIEPSMLKRGRNVVAIEVNAYNVNSFCVLDHPGFVQAEVEIDGAIVAATGSRAAAFEGTRLAERVRRVPRYSFQRGFSEVYRLKPSSGRWRASAAAWRGAEKLTSLPVAGYLPRRAALPAYPCSQPAHHVAQGTLETGVAVESVWKDRSFTDISAVYRSFTEDELEATPSVDIQYTRSRLEPDRRPYHPGDRTMLRGNRCHVLDFGRNLTGFIGAHVVVRRPTRLWLTFDELLEEDCDVSFNRLEAINLVEYLLAVGTYDLESFEPYTLRYLRLAVAGGDCEVTSPYVRLSESPSCRAAFASSDTGLNRLFAAAEATFAQNAVDVLMDCPSRERAGWLCDSFFSSRVAFDLTGDTVIENLFLENYLLPRRFASLPPGMIPMCYPADHPDGIFIPQWSLWFLLQLEEYWRRSGDRDLVRAMRRRVDRLLGWFGQYRNGDGLLEKLPSWNFIEWSTANLFVHDVNYPTNMLYAAALDAVGGLYGLEDATRDAERIRATVVAQSWDGEFFVDNAARGGDGSLEVTRNRTEVCQYYAFYFGAATPETHPELWRKLTTEFGPARTGTGAHPDIHVANAFVGNYLRMELLSRYGLFEQERREIMAFFLKMAGTTGTLWENMESSASCNHGFASHVARWILRDMLGVVQIDQVNKTVTVRAPQVGLDFCEARLPVADGGVVRTRWEKGSEGVRAETEVPAGYRLKQE